MYKLYFINDKGAAIFIQMNHNLKSINTYIDADMTLRGFKKAPYIRSWLGEFEDKKGQWIDFGSWSSFYFIEGVTFEDMCR